MCLSVWQHISQPPILQLNAEHPPSDGFGSLQNGKSIFAEGVIGGLGGEKFCAKKEGYACVTSQREKFCIFLHISLFILCIGKTWMGRILEGRFCQWEPVRREVWWKTYPLEIVYSFFFWIANCIVFLCQSYIHNHMQCLICSLFQHFTAPMELPLKSRSFSLTSHQLKALTQLACTLQGFESDVRELVTNMTFVNCARDTPCVKGTALFLPYPCTYQDSEVILCICGRICVCYSNTIQKCTFSCVCVYIKMWNEIKMCFIGLKLSRVFYQYLVSLFSFFFELPLQRC